MSFTERGPRYRRPSDDYRRSGGDDYRRSGGDDYRRSGDEHRERTIRWPPACRPANELQREMDAALAEAGVSIAPVADGGFQRNRAKAFEVVRKIRSRAPDRPPGRRLA